MTTLSIVLPDNMAKVSQEMAQELGISRTEFIRKAIEHEIKYIKAKFEEQEIIKSMVAMKNNPEYLKFSENFSAFDSDLPTEEDEWWTKKF